MMAYLGWLAFCFWFFYFSLAAWAMKEKIKVKNIPVLSNWKLVNDKTLTKAMFYFVGQVLILSLVSSFWFGGGVVGLIVWLPMAIALALVTLTVPIVWCIILVIYAITGLVILTIASILTFGKISFYIFDIIERKIEDTKEESKIIKQISSFKQMYSVFVKYIWECFSDS